MPSGRKSRSKADSFTVKNRGRVLQNVIASIRKELGAGSFSRSKNDIESHSFDALRTHRGFQIPKTGFPPDLIVYPKSTDDLFSLVKIAHRFRFPLTPYGEGTGLMGGAAAINGGIIIDFKRMNKVLKVNRNDSSVTVQAGISIGNANKVLAKAGLRLGHDPWTKDYASVGGSVSNNGMGYYGGKYGSVGDQILGLTGVLADGTVVKVPAVPYSSTGFDLRRLFIGTEGTIGLISEVTLRCFPIPEAEVVFGYEFPSFEQAFEAALKLRAMDLSPTSLDIRGEGHGGSCNIYIAFSGNNEVVNAYETSSRKLLASLGGKELKEKEVNSYWSGRHVIADMYEKNVARNPLSSFRAEKTFDFIHVALPTSKVIPFWRKISQVAQRRKITIDEYGIWILPELFNFNFTREVDVPSDNLQRTVDDAMRLAIELGGTIEYCHGVGYRLGGFLQEEYGAGFDFMRKLKRFSDPESILNPGKLSLLPEKRLVK